MSGMHTNTMHAAVFSDGNLTLYAPDQTRLLTPTEVAILHRMRRGGGVPVTRAQLALAAYGGCDGPADEYGAISVHITHLRKKLRQIGLPDVIRTIHGVGYIVMLPGELTVTVAADLVDRLTRDNERLRVLLGEEA